MSKAKILIVEDENITAIDINTMLKKLGYPVSAIASTGKEAIQKTSETCPNLVLMDIKLKGDMDGIETAGQIQKRFNIPVVYLSAYADDNTLKRAKITEPFGFILKPFELRELHVGIEIALYKHKMKHSLQESEKKYKTLSREFNTLLESIDEPLIMLSPELKILWTNNSATATFGKKVYEIIGQHCYELFCGYSALCDDCPAVKCLKTKGKASAQHSTPDGRFWDSRAFPMKDENGNVKNIIVATHNITEKTILQAESMRASQLASLGELAATVAHEINNPINGIINYAQLLLDESDSGEIDKAAINNIIKESERIAKSINILLSFARDEGMGKGYFSVLELITEILTLTNAQMQNEGIDIKVDIHPNLPEIIVHPQQIQQVFLNILINSRYALNEKYPGAHKNKIIEITGESVTINDRPYIQIMFYDSGTGISVDEIGKVLNPFYTTKPRGKGTGLGLSISYNIIKEHGGNIELDSAEGEFTKVVISLPAAEKGH